MGQQASAAAGQERELDELRRKLEGLQGEAQEAKRLRAALRKKDGEVCGEGAGEVCGEGEGEVSFSLLILSLHSLSWLSWWCGMCVQVEALRDALQELEHELEEAKRDMTELVDDRQSVSGWSAGRGVTGL